MSSAQKLLLLLPLLLLSNMTFAQTDTTYWKKGGFFNLNFNQVTFVNWAAGGENSISGASLLNGYANYNKGKTSWENIIDLGYGMIRTEEDFRKNEDKIELASKFGHFAVQDLYYTVMLNFSSQFTEGYDYPDDSTVVSDFMAPGYLKLRAGMDYKPTDYFSLFLAPATGKFTFVTRQDLADQGAYGVDPAEYDPETGDLLEHGKKVRPEFGASLKAKFHKDLFKNVNLLAQIDLFNNYTDKEKKNRGNIDVNGEMLLTLKVNKFLTTTLALAVIYDHDIGVPIDDTDDGKPDRKGPRTQFKEVFGIGLTFKIDK